MYGMRALFGTMSDVGEVRTCFLTARLPRWAGVRQNVIGSNIGGLPVPAPETIGYGRTRAGATLITLRNAATAKPLSEQVEDLIEENLQLTANLNALSVRLAAMERAYAELQRDLEPIRQNHNAIVP